MQINSDNNKNTIIVETSSANFWWGIYDFCEKCDWEDLTLYYANGERIGGVSLQTKNHLREGLEDLKQDPDEKHFVIAAEEYLADNKCHYWYYYDKKENTDFYEVSYKNVPINEFGIKPRFLDIWHPDERIDLITIKSGIRDFAHDILGINDCNIKIKEIEESFEQSLENFNEHQRRFFGDKPIEIKFSEELITELSSLWGKPKKDVLDKLKKSM